MSETVRISDKADQFIEEHKLDSENTQGAIDRLLGVNEEKNGSPITKSEAEQIFEEKLQKLKEDLK